MNLVKILNTIRDAFNQIINEEKLLKTISRNIEILEKSYDGWREGLTQNDRLFIDKVYKIMIVEKGV